MLTLNWSGDPLLQVLVERRWLLLVVAMLGGVISLRAWRWLPRIPRALWGRLVTGALAVGSLLAWLVLTGRAGFLWWSLVGFGGIALVYGVVVAPRRAAPLLPSLTAEEWKQLDSKDRAELANARHQRRNELRNTIVQGVAGLAVFAGAIVAWQQLSEDRQQAIASQELTRQGQASERFTAAIEQLGSGRTETQIGGIYGLEQVARQAPATRLAVTEVLVAYVRRRAPLPETPSARSESRARLSIRAPDVQAALTVLGRRSHEPEDPRLNLQGLDLGGADLAGAVLAGANLSGANLSDADLAGAVLVGANLTGSNLSHAVLAGTNLSNAYLSDADLGSAVLAGAQLSSANLSNAILTEAVLSDVVLIGAILTDADLSDAHLDGVRLKNAYLSGAVLVGATLNDTYLIGAYLTGVNLSDAILSDVILVDAVADRHTIWPRGFNPEKAQVRIQP